MRQITETKNQQACEKQKKQMNQQKNKTKEKNNLLADEKHKKQMNNRDQQKK